MQTPWKLSFNGDPQEALAAAAAIPGILPKELVSLQELINVGTECEPQATSVEVQATETVEVGKECVVTQVATFNSVLQAGAIKPFSQTGAPLVVKAAIQARKDIPQWLRWSGDNGCDEVNLTGAPTMTLSVSAKIAGRTTVCTVVYSFPYQK